MIITYFSPFLRIQFYNLKIKIYECNQENNTHKPAIVKRFY